jgi:hypothetical protein
MDKTFLDNYMVGGKPSVQTESDGGGAGLPVALSSD